jgi:hypothetical protein
MKHALDRKSMNFAMLREKLQVFINYYLLQNRLLTIAFDFYQDVFYWIENFGSGCYGLVGLQKKVSHGLDSHQYGHWGRGGIRLSGVFSKPQNIFKNIFATYKIHYSSLAFWHSGGRHSRSF